MKCISWNIRGLESPNRKYIVRRMLNKHKDLDFVMLQEVKASSFSLDVNLTFVWKDTLRICTKHNKGKGGVVILIYPKWKASILCSEISPCNRAVWVSIKDGDSTFGICTVYAPNDYRERADLWQWISSLPDIPWIVGGDFNMIEH